MSTPLSVGAEAWCVVTERGGRERRTVLGAALVRVEALDGERFRVRVVRGSGIADATPIVVDRHELFARADPTEHAAFGALVRRYWSEAWRGERGGGRRSGP